MRALIAFACLASSATMAWTPPPTPDPQKILNEARSDRVAGRYEDALQKHLWFHKEALKSDPAFAGVRLSFALGDWVHLGSKYPPALAALRKVRDEAAHEVLAGRDARSAFHDLAAINRELDENAQTQRLFREIEALDPPLARKLYASAQPALIEMNDFATCAKYMQADAEIERILDAYRHIAKRAPFPDAQDTAHRMLATHAGQIIAALVRGNRADDARRAWAAAYGASDSAQVRAVLDAALKGTMPAPLVTREQKATLRAQMP